MNKNQFSNYVEQFSQKYKGLLYTDENPRFIKMGITEVVTSANINLDTKKHFIVLEDNSFSVDGPNFDQSQKVNEFSLLFLKNVPPQDYKEQLKTEVECEEIGWKLVSMMMHDKERQTKEMRGFDLMKTEGEQVGPFFDNCFGVRMSFIFIHDISSQLIFNPQDFTQ